MADMGAASKVAEQKRIAEMSQESHELIPRASAVVQTPNTER
jgi:hypothetical protein